MFLLLFSQQKSCYFLRFGFFSVRSGPLLFVSFRLLSPHVEINNVASFFRTGNRSIDRSSFATHQPSSMGRARDAYFFPCEADDRAGIVSSLVAVRDTVSHQPVPHLQDYAARDGSPPQAGGLVRTEKPACSCCRAYPFVATRTVVYA